MKDHDPVKAAAELSIELPSLHDLIIMTQLMMLFAAGGPSLAREGLAFMVKNRVVLAKTHLAGFGCPHPVYGSGDWASACVEVTNIPFHPDAGMSRAQVLAMSVACQAVAGEIFDPTQGATRCHRHDIEPDWAAAHVATAILGDVVFYKTLGPQNDMISNKF